MKPALLPALLIAITICTACHRAGAQNIGFTQQDIIKISGQTTDAQVGSLNAAQKQSTRSYYDGLGRPLQTVSMQASPLKNDLIQPMSYDNTGAPVAAYLPYAGKSTDISGSFRSAAAGTDQPAFYNNTSQPLIPVDQSPYSQQVFENSPLRRLLYAGMPGAGYQPPGASLTGGSGTQHYKSVQYRYNSAAKDASLILWGPDGSKQSTGYSDLALSVTDARDEDGVETLTYTDIAGHTVLKRQVVSSSISYDTYYIYNNAGVISFIVPPKAVALMNTSGNYSLAQANISPLLYKFTYNAYGQLTSKTVPGKGVMNIIYDPLKRPVLIQDANLAAQYKWNYIKYDVKGRVISQGIYTDASHALPADLQTSVNNMGTGYASAWFETRTSAAATFYYSNNIFPTANLQPLAYAYYDDYDLNQDAAHQPDFNYQPAITGEQGATQAALKGMPTMTLKSTVSNSAAAVWLITVQFYDRNLHPVQTQTNNLLNYGGMAVITDIKTYLPDFTGMPLTSKVTKVTGSGTGGTTTVVTGMSYDHRYRLTAVTQQYNGGSIRQVAAYQYNELGQLVNKGLGIASAAANVTLGTANSVGATGNSTVTATTSIVINPNFSVAAGGVFSASIAPPYLQQVDYRYNIRGQLTNINNSKLTADGGATQDDPGAVFGMQLLYDGTDNNLGNTPYFSGRLSAVKWMSRDGSGNKGYERSYRYSYDALNRYTGAVYAERLNTAAANDAFNVNTGGWNEAVTAYDENGNIQGLTRNASTPGAAGGTQTDNLAYGYNPNNLNQLQIVTDGTDAAHTQTGFRNYTGSTAAYQYGDANGNLTADPYKGMQLSYNVLNRTDNLNFTTASGRYINYIYDASGSVLRKQQYDGGTLKATTDYVDGFVYVNSTLSYFPMPEGRVTNAGGALTAEYIITDQQGNARLSFTGTGAGGAARVVQETSYYGFGMTLPGSAVPVPNTPNKNLYNGGAEWQNDYADLPDLQQTFYRNYDAALGRWVSVDPQAESAESLTPYQYAGNNPVMGNDPLGNLLKPIQQAYVNPNVQGGGGSEFAAEQAAYYAGLYSSTFGGGGGAGGDFGGFGGGGDGGDSYFGDTPAAQYDYVVSHYGLNVYQAGAPGQQNTMESLQALLASDYINVGTNSFTSIYNDAEFSNYGNMRGGIVVTDYGIYNPNSLSSGDYSYIGSNTKASIESNNENSLLSLNSAVDLSMTALDGVLQGSQKLAYTIAKDPTKVISLEKVPLLGALGNIAAGISAGHKIYQGITDFNNHKLDLAEGVGTLAVAVFAPEFLLGYSLITTGVDLIRENYDK